ncbi:MAG: S8 family peptidase [Gemmobacter sp.]
MDAERFIILRDANAGLRGFGPGSGGFAGGIRAETGFGLEVPPDPQFDVQMMDEAEAMEMLREPDIIDVARAMPMRLIEPEAASAPGALAQSGGPTWGVAAVGADASPFDGTDVTVAVLDTGADAGHPAFAGMNLVQQDFTGTGNQDANGHGSHCAGTIFGRDVGGTRIGVAPGVSRALIGKVLDDRGSGTSDMLFQAMQWASGNGAQVISMSLGFDFPGFAERLQQQGFPALLATSIALEGYRMNLRMFDKLMELMRAQAAFGTGTLVVAAAGNESRRQQHPNFEVSVSVPAVAEGVVSVGALAEGGQGMTVAPFSNTNPTVAAPGVGVISARTGGGLVALNGTSMACPHVAGVAALWWQAVRAANIPATVRAVEARLLTSTRTDVFASGVRLAQRGLGLVRAPSAAIS